MIEDTSSTATDRAWVEIETRARPQEVWRFLGKVERFFRINPYLEIDSWSEPQAGAYRTTLRNLSNGRQETVCLSARRRQEKVLLLAYAQGLKRSTRIDLERCDRGSRVRITDDYGGSPLHERLARTTEVDRSLTAWGLALRTYLDREHRYGRWALWHLWLDRVWLPMRPAARRIAFVLTAVALAEVALTALIVLVLWLEGRALE